MEILLQMYHKVKWLQMKMEVLHYHTLVPNLKLTLQQMVPLLLLIVTDLLVSSMLP